MYIKQFKIKNFKSFQDVEFNFNQDLNILTGVNNSGKTSVLEALALWNECFNLLVKKAEQNIKPKNKVIATRGQFYFEYVTENNYFSVQTLQSIRLVNAHDIFYNLDTNLTIELEAGFSNDLNLAFTIQSYNVFTYAINAPHAVDLAYETFKNSFHFPNPIQLTYASPVGNLKTQETYEREPMIKHLLNSRNSYAILRNRLMRLKERSDDFEKFARDLSYILGLGLLDSVQFDLQLDRKQIYINCQIAIGERDTMKDISLLGSGTLQMIEILLGFYERNTDLNVVLLDEPDSYIHRDIQKRLVEVLLRYTNNTQVFITTHNESLIRNSNPQYLFHIEAKPQAQYKSIIHENIQTDTKHFKGLFPSPQIKIAKNISGGNGLDFVNALEADKIVFVEGEDDARHIDILSKNLIGLPKKYAYWVMGGEGSIIANVRTYKDIFEKIKNEKSLWEKSVLVFDRDEWLTDTQRTKLISEFSQKLSISTYLWESRNFEATLLSDKEKLKNIVSRYLLNLGINSDFTIISQTIEQKIEEILVRKQAYYFDGTDFSAKFQKELTSKFNYRKNIFEIEKTTDAEKEDHTNRKHKNNLYIYEELIDMKEPFKRYYEHIFSQKLIHKVAKKEDVAEIINSVTSPLGKTFDFEHTNDFEELLKFAFDNHFWYSDWDGLIELLKS